MFRHAFAERRRKKKKEVMGGEKNYDTKKK